VNYDPEAYWSHVGQEIEGVCATLALDKFERVLDIPRFFVCKTRLLDNARNVVRPRMVNLRPSRIFFDEGLIRRAALRVGRRLRENTTDQRLDRVAAAQFRLAEHFFEARVGFEDALADVHWGGL